MSAEQMPQAGTDTGMNQTTQEPRLVEKLNCKGFHLPTVSTDRAKALLPAVAADPEFNWDGGLSVAYVLRWAVKLGLDALERRYQPAPASDELGGFDEEAIRRIVREELALATQPAVEEEEGRIQWTSAFTIPIDQLMPPPPGRASSPEDGEVV